MHATPASLLDRLRSPADADAWVRFVRLYTPFLYHWARKRGLSADDTADLVQEVFTQLLKALPTFTYRGSRNQNWSESGVFFREDGVNNKHHSSEKTPCRPFQRIMPSSASTETRFWEFCPASTA